MDNSIYLFVKSFDMDIVNLGESPSCVSPNEEGVFKEGLAILWKAALIYSGHPSTSKVSKLAVNQEDLDKIKIETQEEFKELSRQLRSSSADHATHAGTASPYGPSQDQDGANLFFKVANHFYFNTSGQEFRVTLGHCVRRYDFHRKAIPSNGGQYIPSGRAPSMKFVESVLRCLMIVCKIDGMCGSFPIHVTHQNIVKCQKQMRNRDKSLGKELVVKSGLNFCDVFFLALLVLVLRHYVVGELRRYTGRRASKVINDWYMQAFCDITKLEFVVCPETTSTTSSTCNQLQLGALAQPAQTNLNLQSMAYLQNWANFQTPQLEEGFTVQDFASTVPVFLENPTAFLEEMWFVYPYNGLRRHVTYCRYGTCSTLHVLVLAALKLVWLME